MRGEFQEAENLLRQSLLTAERLPGAKPASTISTLGTLGALYLRQGRLDEAKGIFNSAADRAEKAYGPSSPEAAEMINSLASAYASMGQTQEAEAAFRRVLDIALKGGDRSLDLAAGAANNLATVLKQMGKNDEALNAYHQAYDLNVKFFGQDNPAPMLNLMNAAVLYRDMGNFPVAEQMMTTVLSYRERTIGPDHPETIVAQNNVGWLELAKNSPEAALPYFRKAVAGYQQIRARQIRGLRGDAASVPEREVGRSILGLLNSLSQVSAKNLGETSALRDEGFQAAQSVHTNVAAMALSRAGARLAAGGGELSDLLREGQDLAAKLQQMDETLTKSFYAPDSRRNPAFEQATANDIKSYATRLDAIDAEVARKFPDYTNLTDPQPVSITKTQSFLDPNEALVLISSFGGSNGTGTFVWIVTKQDVRATASDLSLETIADEVWTLRCGLDIGAWSTKAGSDDCTKRNGPMDENGLPRFNAKASYNLFKSLFGGFEPILAGKSLIIVAPDPLASLPFQVLVTQPPSEDFPMGLSALRNVSWLGRHNPISILPSISALQVLRAGAARAEAPKSYIAFGDPLLTGNTSCPSIEPSQECPGPASVAQMHLASSARSSSTLGGVFKKGLVDVEAVRSLCPLPDTATELNCVASSIGATPDSVYLGDRATIANLRAAGLEQYRIIHFATHGLVAGDLVSADGSLGEPALVLSPPALATADDDGLLKASDIAGLKLNADWVIMSACNTASGQIAGGETLSGLASAFLYAGARTLLASHWPVSSDAAVRLTTVALGELAKDPNIGRAEAMRRSMVNILDHGGEFDAHPMIWAPFSVIGEAGQGHM